LKRGVLRRREVTVGVAVGEIETKHMCLREVLRNYLMLKTAAENEDWTFEICRIKGCIWYNSEIGVQKGHEGDCEMLTVNFLDLKNCLKKLSKRKMEAVYYNVILDMRQREVAEIMGITMVSIGQYVEAGMKQAAAELWPDVEETD
jgi:hypothetical protein